MPGASASFGRSSRPGGRAAFERLLRSSILILAIHGMKLHKCKDVFSPPASTACRRTAPLPVALLGPRQAGKTTLALEVAKSLSSVYLDLESEHDLAKLAQPELYLADHLDKLVILDEVHRSPGLFPVLRGLIDQARRDGKRAGRYLLLGSASLELLHQSGETLAGRFAPLAAGRLP